MGKLLSQVLNKSRTLLCCTYDDDHGGQHHHYHFWCPACRRLHLYNTEGEIRWSFDGNLESPTFKPSLKYTGGPAGVKCHLWCKNGVLEYCNDTPHAEFKGKSVPMVEMDESMLGEHTLFSVPIQQL